MAIDRGLARLLERIEPDVTVLVISADGMGPNHACPQHLPEALHRLGVFHGQGVGATVGDEEMAPRRRGLVAAARASIPLSVRQTVSRCLPRRVHYRLSMRWANDAIDWERTRAFCIPNSNEGYVRVRRQGRDPGGAESPESARELLDLLERTARTLAHPDTGHPAAARVVRVDDVLDGPRRDDLPDLIVAWDPAARVGRRLAGDRIDTVEGRAGFETAPFYTGNHRPNAFVAARGPSVRAGAVIDGDVMDLAPTALALLDVEPTPRHVGSTWREVTG